MPLFEKKIIIRVLMNIGFTLLETFWSANGLKSWAILLSHRISDSFIEFRFWLSYIKKIMNFHNWYRRNESYEVHNNISATIGLSINVKWPYVKAVVKRSLRVYEDSLDTDASVVDKISSRVVSVVVRSSISVSTLTCWLICSVKSDSPFGCNEITWMWYTDWMPFSSVNL